MKKITKNKYNYIKRRDANRRKTELRRAGIRRSRRYRRKFSGNLKEITMVETLRIKRNQFRRNFYKTIKYNKPHNNVEIKNQFGLENDFDNFIKIAASFIDSHSKWVEFDLRSCTRMWPTAITLLCSFKQWTEITAHPGHKPILSSTLSDSEEVDSYLAHSGFYDYVNTVHEGINTDIYDDDEIVKIQRENDKSEINAREDSIIDILKNYSGLSSDEIEDFDCNVLIEAFNNVTEHGTSHYDDGWWTLTQYHKRTGIISLCLADNGIGVMNSLLTGPQSSYLKKEIGSENDGDFILAALNENVSGALKGSIKDKGIPIIYERYGRGSRRGNGLKRIQEACKRCGIAFSLLSQSGYLCIDPLGNIKKTGTENARVFAGTLYHFSIPAK